MLSSIRSLLFVLALLLLALGCASTSSVPAPTTTQSTPIAETQASSVKVSKKSAALAPVYFATDLAVLQAEARDALEHYAKSILEHPEWGVLSIDGHCDERGSDEHNLGLGKARATAVERYLVDLGVPRSRLATRSFGAHRPAVRGHDEGAWRYNRRTELRRKHELASK